MKRRLGLRSTWITTFRESAIFVLMAQTECHRSFSLVVVPHHRISLLKTAIELFSWLGERADFALPTFGFVSSKDMEGKE